MREEGARAELRLKMICHTIQGRLFSVFFYVRNSKKYLHRELGQNYTEILHYIICLFSMYMYPPPSSPLKMSNCIIHMCFMCFANKYCLVYKLDFVYSS